MVGVGPDQREDSYEHDLEFALFAKAADARGMVLEAMVWDAPGIDWSSFAAVMVGTTWDYVQKCDLFYQVLAEIDGKTRLFNDLATLRMNGDKGYLLKLAAKGIATIPTLRIAKCTQAQIDAAYAHFGCDELVVKPIVGGGAWRQARVQKGQPLPAVSELPPEAAFVQPFLPGILDKGELSMLFYDGQYSHGIRKTPKAGEYRIQSIYGGIEQAADPSDAEIALARKALSALVQMPLYARVDVVPGLSGEPLLIELELIEPYHYVEQGPDCGEMLIDALVRRLG